MSEERGHLPTPPEVPRKAADEKPGWLVRPRSVRLFKVLGCLAVLALFGIDFFLHYHEYVGWENVPGYYTIFGLITSVLLIGIAKVGGRPLKRKEDYYDE